MEQPCGVCWKMGPQQLALGTLGEICCPCSGLSNISPQVSLPPRFPLEDLFFLISFFFFSPTFPAPLLSPFCQHFLLVNESKKEFFLGGRDHMDIFGL